MKRLMLMLFVGIFFISGNVNAQTPEYSKKVKTLLELTGTEENFQMVVDQLVAQMQMSRTDVPAEIWAGLKREMKKTSIDDLVKLLAPVYNKHLTEKDLDGIIAFYQTPIGKKYGEKMPAITKDSMMAGQKWGMELGAQLAKSLKAKGY